MYGRNSMTPKTPAVIAAIRTAPAAISLANFALGCSLSVNASTIASIAVLVSSKEITNPVRKIIINQSVLEIRKNIEAAITIKPAKK